MIASSGAAPQRSFKQRRGINSPAQTKNPDDFERLEAEFLKDPEFKAESDALEPEYELIRQLIRARADNNMTQKQLAEKVATRQSNIARLESGNYNPSFQFLQKVAKALNKKLTIELR